ncbi:hypothetical protein B0A50_00184 [Salinomyces thailandicus]|uniref:Uncharacterized protein n=1 Tax=Salinomyces thailandicus TaxID=706561 RepID=A0A4U0UFI1_9PEZI|nr:hypothetical protein B0A50_00184 [Salinomyces thailandica]
MYDSRVPRLLQLNGIKAAVDSDAPANEEALKALLGQRRPSLSPTRFDAETMYQNFFKANEFAENETAAMQSFVSHLNTSRQIYTGGMNTAFVGLESLTNASVNLPPPEPDLWDGTRPFGRIDQDIHMRLAHHI